MQLKDGIPKPATAPQQIWRPCAVIFPSEHAPCAEPDHDWQEIPIRHYPLYHHRDDHCAKCGATRCVSTLLDDLKRQGFYRAPTEI